jgi:hypothetical protein
MKLRNLFSIFLLFLVATSCTVHKRHFSKGYFISWNKAYKIEQPTQQEKPHEHIASKTIDEEILEQEEIQVEQSIDYASENVINIDKRIKSLQQTESTIPSHFITQMYEGNDISVETETAFYSGLISAVTPPLSIFLAVQGVLQFTTGIILFVMVVSLIAWVISIIFLKISQKTNADINLARANKLRSYTAFFIVLGAIGLFIIFMLYAVSKSLSGVSWNII